jgi:NAD(P)-dependent dehydrogenase (short-subunit alcohol dehydrogenase family)
MAGRVCLVTGATQGIGKVTARELARMGAEVILVARSRERGEAAVAEIAEATGRTPELRLADLGLLSEVRRLAAEVRAAHARLHVLINNAGAMHTARKLTAEGLETTVAVNHLAYFLLARELLPLLEASGTPERKARIVNVASRAHFRARLDLDDLQLARRGYGHPLFQYSNSKLMNVLHTYELARRLAGSNVTANCLHPGVIASGFGRNDRGPFAWAIRLAAPFMLSPERGAETTIHLATSPEVEGVSGKYFDAKKPRRSSRASYDEVTQRRLWELSEELVDRAENGRAAAGSAGRF